MSISTNPVTSAVARDMYREVVMANAAEEFMTTEFGGEFDPKSVIATPDSFSAVVKFSFDSNGISFKAGTRVKMDENGNIIGVLFR